MRVVFALAYLLVIALLAHPIGEAIPGTAFHPERFPLRTYPWETRLYRLLRVAKWKDKVPDMSKRLSDMQPKKLLSASAQQMDTLLCEMCRAESVHWAEVLLGIGCGSLTELYTRLGDQLSESDTVVVICGNNRSLVRQLTAIPVRTHSRILGFTDQISTYMDAADCFVTKAGGISITEAIAKETPTILLNAIGGCEACNYRFMTENGLMLGAESADEAAEFILNERYKYAPADTAAFLHQKLIRETLRRFCRKQDAANAAAL